MMEFNWPAAKTAKGTSNALLPDGEGRAQGNISTGTAALACSVCTVRDTMI